MKNKLKIINKSELISNLRNKSKLNITKKSINNFK